LSLIPKKEKTRLQSSLILKGYNPLKEKKKGNKEIYAVFEAMEMFSW